MFLLLVPIAQLILNILGFLGILGGTVALLFGNTQRGIELLVGGVIFVAIRVILGILFVGLGLKKPKSNTNELTPYEQLVNALDAIKEGAASRDHKIKISRQLIDRASITKDEKTTLHDMVKQVYKTP